MEINKQSQTAGDNARQLQFVNPTIVCGIDEKRVREVCSELAVETIKTCTAEASATATQRIDAFTTMLIPRIEKIERDFQSFADPGFQFALRRAQRTAASTERQNDYAMLSELLVHRIENSVDRKKKTSIDRAIEIVDQIDDDALCGLTILYTLFYFGPSQGEISNGLYALDSLFKSLRYMPLPTATDWVFQLDMLGAIRLSPIGKFKRLQEFAPALLPGYVCVGIKKNSDNYRRALEALDEINMEHDTLVDHELLNGYVRLELTDRKQIPQIRISRPIAGGQLLYSAAANAKEQDVLNRIYDLYSTDEALKNQVRKAFMEKWDSFESLRTVRLWMESLQNSFDITPIGNVLAHANAQRCNKNVPKFDG